MKFLARSHAVTGSLRQVLRLAIASALVTAAVVPLSTSSAATGRGPSTTSPRPAAATPSMRAPVWRRSAAASGAAASAEPAASNKPYGAALTGSPGLPIADPAHHTLYVPIQCVHDFCGDGKASHDLDILNTDRCKSATTHCHVVATARLGASPFAAALDSATHTLYVANAGSTDPSTKGLGSVSVLDTKTCNASKTAGCHKPLATIHTGGYLVAAALDPATGTLYLANVKGSVIAVDVRRCTAATQRGCHRHLHRVKDKSGPSGVAVDQAHSTVYASETGLDSSGNTVSLINAATCNGHRATGCGQKPHQVTVGFAPYWDTVDQKTDTVYVANGNEDNVSVINARTCNAHVRSGCPKQAAKTITTGGSPQFVLVDQSLHTAFVLNSNDNTVAELDTKTCRGGSLQKCPSVARSKLAAPDQTRFYVNFAAAFAMVPKTSTLYLTAVGGRSTLGVTNVRHCSATSTSACRKVAPGVRATDSLMTVNSATHTLYAGSFSDKRIDLFNTATCNSATRAHCGRVASVPIEDSAATLSDVNAATHTLYVTDFDQGDVSVIDTSACTASTTSGCATAVKATVHIGEGVSGLVENPTTHTLYVIFGPFSADPNQVAVLDTAACKAADTSGCTQTPVSVPVGQGANLLGLSAATNTVYVANSGIPDNGFGHTVSVIDGATCDATVHTGCAAPVATANVGVEPFGVTVDDATHSVYVVANADGDAPGGLYLIDSATCNGSTTTGCAGSHPAVGIGRSGLIATVDQSTHKVYVADFSSAAVSLVNGSTCSGTSTAGCRQTAPLLPVASQPFGLAVDPAVHTVYVGGFGQGGTLSLLNTH